MARPKSPRASSSREAQALEDARNNVKCLLDAIVTLDHYAVGLTPTIVVLGRRVLRLGEQDVPREFEIERALRNSIIALWELRINSLSFASKSKAALLELIPEFPGPGVFSRAAKALEAEFQKRTRTKGARKQSDKRLLMKLPGFDDFERRLRSLFELSDELKDYLELLTRCPSQAFLKERDDREELYRISERRLAEIFAYGRDDSMLKRLLSDGYLSDYRKEGKDSRAKLWVKLGPSATAEQRLLVGAGRPRRSPTKPGPPI
jgi:hypothetical protein